MRWMNVEPILRNEVSQKEKNKYLILTRIFGIQKDVLMSLFSGQQWRRRHRHQTCGHGRGAGRRRRWDEWKEQHGNIHTTTCTIDGQRGVAL